MIEHKFYDIEPRSGGHVLLQNGCEVARFDELPKAEAVRSNFVAEVAELYDRRPEAPSPLQSKAGRP